MTTFNRAFVALWTCLWCAGLAVGLLLVWDRALDISADSAWITGNFNLIFDTRAEQILATIILGALALPALLLLAMELVPQRGALDRGMRHRDESYGALQARVEGLEKRLSDERDLRKDTQRDAERERRILREQAERDARMAREPARVATAADQERPRRHGWRFLPGR